MDGQNPSSTTPTQPASGGGSGKVIAGIIILIIIIIAAFYALRGNEGTDSMQTESTQETGDAMMEETDTTPADQTPADSMMEGDAMVKEFTVTGTEFKFSLPEIRVKQGEKVRLTLTNGGAMPHDWVVDEFTGARTKVLQAGGTETIEFTADKKGTFEYYCSVGQHRQAGMVGNLIVE